MIVTTIVQSRSRDHWAVVRIKNDSVIGVVADCKGATKEEALGKYREHLLSHWRAYTVNDEQHKCKVCGEWTSTYAKVGLFSTLHWLCSAHLSDNEVAKLFELPVNFEIFES